MMTSFCFNDTLFILSLFLIDIYVDFVKEQTIFWVMGSLDVQFRTFHSLSWSVAQSNYWHHEKSGTWKLRLMLTVVDVMILMDSSPKP